MPEKNRITIYLDGHEYTLSGEESSEYLYRLGLYIQGVLKKVRERDISSNSGRVALMTAINVGDDYLKLEEAFEALQKENKALRQQLEKAGDNAVLEEEVEKLRKALSEKEKELEELIKSL